jgi:PAS domain S-box-containing protein
MLGSPTADPELRLALAVGGVGVWSWDLGSDLISADETARRLWAFPPDGRVPMRLVRDAILPADFEQVRRAAAGARGGGDLNVVFRIRRGDEIAWMRVRARATDGPKGRRITGVTIDVTDRMRIESALADTEARLRRAQELGGALPFELEPDGAITAPDAFKALYGIGPDDPFDAATLLSRIHPDDRARVEAQQRELLAASARYETEYRVQLRDGAVRWLLSRGESIPAGQGRPARVAGVSIDITARKQVEEDLRTSRRSASTRLREVRALYQNAPVGLAYLDRDLRYVRINERLAQINGRSVEEHVGRAAAEVVPEAFEKIETIAREVFATGEPVTNVEIDYPSPLHPGGPGSFNCHFYPIEDDNETVVGIGIAVEDVTAFRQAARTRDLLARELSHRIKNLFAVVASIVSLSARGDAALQAFARTIRGRIEALGRAHDYVRPPEWGASATGSARTVQTLLRALLAPYAQEGLTDRVVIRGPDRPIGQTAATPLALAVHEFATNAMKYGALSVVGGTIEIACSESGDAFSFCWTERGGPALDGAPDKEGFGTLLARRSVTGDLRGELSIDWTPDGVVIRVAAPVERLGS